MAVLTWGPALEVGFGDIDVQHRRLVELLNQLEDAVATGREREATAEVVDEVVRYTRLHFAFEEKLMQRHGIEESEEHLAEHASLARDAVEYRRRFGAGENGVADELVAFLSDWLRNHILGTDAELARELNARGVHSAAKGTR